MEIDRDEVELFLTDLTENCRKIHSLDLSSSPVDARCCELLCDLPRLRVLKLDDCAAVDTATVAHVVGRLGDNLAQLECGNRLQSALAATTPDENGNGEATSRRRRPLSLKSVTFRQPTGVGAVARDCPGVHRVRVVHSDYENTGILDREMEELNAFEAAGNDGLKVDLEMNSINMLFLIQVY